MNERLRTLLLSITILIVCTLLISIVFSISASCVSADRIRSQNSGKVPYAVVGDTWTFHKETYPNKKIVSQGVTIITEKSVEDTTYTVIEANSGEYKVSVSSTTTTTGTWESSGYDGDFTDTITTYASKSYRIYGASDMALKSEHIEAKDTVSLEIMGMPQNIEAAVVSDSTAEPPLDEYGFANGNGKLSIGDEWTQTSTISTTATVTTEGQPPIIVSETTKYDVELRVEEITDYDPGTGVGSISCFRISQTGTKVTGSDSKNVAGSLYFSTDTKSLVYDESESIKLTSYNLATPPNHPPVIIPISSQTAIVGSKFTLRINATDEDGDALTYMDDSPLFTINSTTGIIRFIPANTDKGAHAITINVSDGHHVVSSTFTLLILNRPPTIQPIANQVAFVGSEFTLQINATDEDGDTLTYMDDSPLFIINSTTGLIRFIPTNADKGLYLIAVNVTDGIDKAITMFILSIPNRVPIISPIANQVAFVDSEFTLQINATDADNDTLTYIHNSPLFTINSATGLIRFIPTNADKGLYIVRVNVTDGTDKATEMFILSIIPNHSPTIQAINNQIAFVGTEFMLQINATDEDGDDLTYIDDSPLFAINSTTGLMVFTPLATNIGNHMIRIFVNDTKAVTSISFILTINAPPTNHTPTITITSQFDDKINGTIIITGTLSSDPSIQYLQVSIDGGDWMNAAGGASWTYSLDKTELTDGKHTIKIRVYNDTQYSTSSTEKLVEIVVENAKDITESKNQNETPSFELTNFTLRFVIGTLLWCTVIFSGYYNKTNRWRAYY